MVLWQTFLRQIQLAISTSTACTIKAHGDSDAVAANAVTDLSKHQFLL